ncbi:WXG100 family type VII secretion target [Streptomyces sp. NPDC090108]|uniref:WXG100 family type VII secretion target n=1 Tax=Streptomyces sp. NPDC090108 TaxID=3365947 RepID=UPI0037F8E4CC
MPTYHEVVSCDLSALTAAADRWDGMAGEFEKQESAYRRHVYGVSAGAGWSGMSAEAAHGRFGVTLGQFQDAQTEARAIASLLRDAHAQFTELRGRLRTAREEAEAAGMRVSDRGIVAVDPGRAAAASGGHGVYGGGRAEGGGHGAHGGGHAEGGGHGVYGGGRAEGAGHGAFGGGRTETGAGAFLAHAESAVRGWQDRIDAAVRAVTDADTGVRVALTAAVVDSGPSAGGRGFNGRALGDVEKYEALSAEGPLERLSRGDRLSPRELAELDRLFRDNSGDTAFARTVLDDLGARGTILLTNELNDRIHGGSGRPGAYAAVESGLADSLAAATRNTDSSWYRHWRTAMRHAGVRRWATDVQGQRLDKAVGYQSLVTLMRQGHGYAPRMLADLTDDMVAAEKREPGIWRLKERYSGSHGGWFANDPVDGALGLMSRDPAAAAHYLSSDAHMRYLTAERDWKVTLYGHEGAKAGTYEAGLDADDRAGFGAALKAATTGIDPSSGHAHHVAHTKENEAVLRSALSHLAGRGDGFPASLRRPMADILVNHGSTVHASAGEIDISRSPLDQHQLFEVTKQVSKDPGAYGTLNGGLNQALVSGIHADRSASTESLVRAGRTVGFLEEARIQAQGDPKTAEFKEKPLFDKAISYLPVAGDEVQQGFDYVTDKWLEDEQKRLDGKRVDENFHYYSRRNGQLMALASQWRVVHPHGVSPYFDPRDEISESAMGGIEHARGVSGVQPK